MTRSEKARYYTEATDFFVSMGTLVYNAAGIKPRKGLRHETFEQKGWDRNVKK